MALHHDRAARGQRRGGVAARHREGQREVRRAEHRHRADGPLHHAQIGTRQGLTVGQRRVMAAVEIVALLDVLGEQAKLAGGAPALALQARFGQAGFLRPDLGDRVAARLDLVGDGVEKRRALSRLE
jgi:hypothetical protein